MSTNGPSVAMRGNKKTMQGSRMLTLEKGLNYVVVQCGEIVFIGTYFSPNKPLHEFDEYTITLSRIIRKYRAKPVIVCGDLNSRHAMWDSGRGNPRGERLADWAAVEDLCLLNEGREVTNVNVRGSSSVDMTWATLSARNKVTK
ncbi:PREDICTED: uncharacterized protein LOC108781731 [Cyphomyrmex costatus]|uniref:uncharacterized protein LOC108781731 n=1 Tax=Cyphomyrmex costatus TaxID=456900 RepID=UPI000852236D|nr:PREDICTED: uncharacterized protein LOC108781731 [Cyphomyrmex costatus]